MHVKKPLDDQFGSKTRRPRQADIDQLVEQTHGADEVPPRSSRGARATQAADDIIYDLTDAYDDDTDGNRSDVPPPPASKLGDGLRVTSPNFFLGGNDPLHDDQDHARFKDHAIPEILREPAHY
ncbi:MAG: hypothetical protein WA001_00895 [Patescibacteria group bacterium]